MRKSGKPGFDRSSTTFADASEIMGSGKSAPAVPKPGATHSIDVEMGDNGGVVVNHREKTSPPKPGSGDFHDPSGPRKQNIFGDAHAAHAHIGKLMGVGHPPKGAGGGLT